MITLIGIRRIIKSRKFWIASCESAIRPRNDEVVGFYFLQKQKVAKTLNKDFLFDFLLDSCNESQSK